jgi:hypothetical protein
MPRIEGLRPQLTNLDTGEPVDRHTVVGQRLPRWLGHRAALDRGADVVICPRVTDARSSWDRRVVVGWAGDDWDALAGAVVAGHVIECGAQTTGGNYSFFERSRSRHRRGSRSPRSTATVRASSPSTPDRWLVSIGTVTAQLLYEIGAPLYLNPDVVRRLRSIRLTDDGPDRVSVRGVRGLPAPPTTKVSINFEGGCRNRVTFVLTGPKQHAKAAWAEAALFDRLGGKARFDEVDVRFVEGTGGRREPGGLVGQAAHHGQIERLSAPSSGVLIGGDRVGVGQLSRFFVSSPPTEAQPFGVFWPALVGNDEVHQVVVMGDGRRIPIDSAPHSQRARPGTRTGASARRTGRPGRGRTAGPLLRRAVRRQRRQRERRLCGRGTPPDTPGSIATSPWTALSALIPEAAGLGIHRYELPNLFALNFFHRRLPRAKGVAAAPPSIPRPKASANTSRARVWPPPNPTV